MAESTLELESRSEDPKKLTEWAKTNVNYHFEDEEYIENKPLNNNRRFKNTIRYERQGETKYAQIETKQFVGVFQLPKSGNILIIDPKIKSKYLKLLEYALKVKCNDHKPFFYYDYKQKVGAPRGDTFLEVISTMFLAELKKLVKKGLYKEYVKKEENSGFLKGKLIISNNVKKNYINPKFYCRFFDLTVDNFENQVILYATLKTAQLIKHNSDAQRELYKYFNILKEEITLKDYILPYELSQLTTNKKNIHYKEIIELAKILINETFYGSSEERKNHCCNFLIDMNVIFERVIFGIVKEILEPYYSLNVEDQTRYKFSSLIEFDGLGHIKPDITLLEDKKEIAVLDVKYKPRIGNEEIYQIGVYALTLYIKSKELKWAILINYTEGENEDPRKGTIKTSVLSSVLGNINLANISLCLDLDETDYIENIKNQLQKNLFNLLGEVIK